MSDLGLHPGRCAADGPLQRKMTGRRAVLWLGLTLILLAGCATAPEGDATLTPAPASSAPTATPTRALAAGVVTATATPEAAAASAAATPTAALAVRSGRAVRDVAVLDQPGGQPVGELRAGALAIVVESRDDQLKIIYDGAGDDGAGRPHPYGWVAQDAVSFAAPTSDAAAGQATLASAGPAQPATPAVTAATSAPAPARATPAQRPLAGTLVFQDGNGGNIYVMNADGSGLRRLTYGFDPALSPDGRQVAFTRWDEPRGLWVINTDGSGERLVLGANQPRSPDWSPDGQALVFERAAGNTACLQSPFGCLSEDQLLALFGGQPCLATPFGSFCIADFARVSSAITGLVQVDVASGAARDLPASESATSPRYLPGSDAVIYLDKGGFARTGTAGDAPPQRLVQVPPLLAPASPSPDGQFIYAARYAGNRWDLWRWRQDGSQAQALTTPDPLAARAVNSVAPAVSPDGRSLVFLSDRGGAWQLWVMNSDGSDVRRLAPQALDGIRFRYDFSADRMVDWGP